MRRCAALGPTVRSSTAARILTCWTVAGAICGEGGGQQCGPNMAAESAPNRHRFGNLRWCSKILDCGGCMRPDVRGGDHCFGARHHCAELARLGGSLNARRNARL